MQRQCSLVHGAVLRSTKALLPPDNLWCYITSVASLASVALDVSRVKDAAFLCKALCSPRATCKCLPEHFFLPLWQRTESNKRSPSTETLKIHPLEGKTLYCYLAREGCHSQQLSSLFYSQASIFPLFPHPQGSAHWKWACFSDVSFMNLSNKVHRPPCHSHWGSTTTGWTKHHRTMVPIFVQTLTPGYNRKKMLQDLELLRHTERKDVHNTRLRHQWASHIIDGKSRPWLPSAASLCPPLMGNDP